MSKNKDYFLLVKISPQNFNHIVVGWEILALLVAKRLPLCWSTKCAKMCGWLFRILSKSVGLCGRPTMSHQHPHQRIFPSSMSLISALFGQSFDFKVLIIRIIIYTTSIAQNHLRVFASVCCRIIFCN